MTEWRSVPVEGVDVSYEWRGWRIWAQWPTRQRNDIVTLIKVEYAGADVGSRLVKSTSRLNLISSSGLGGLITAMRRVGPDKDDIDQVVQEIAEDLIGWYRRGQSTIYPEPAQRNGTGWLLYPLWPNGGVTGVAAAGGSYKSFVAQAAALQLATGREILAGNTKPPQTPIKTLYLDWEADPATFGERLHALCKGAYVPPEPFLAYRAMRTPLVDAASALADEIGRAGIKAVIIDSMSAATGGDLIESATVNAFYDAVRQLGCPALVLAHKSADNVKKREARFFGSVMSENRVRLAWNGEKATDGESIMWRCFKDNNTGTLGARLAWRLEFGHSGEHEERRLESVGIEAVNPDGVRTAKEDHTAASRIAEVLTDVGPMMPGEIADALPDIPRGTIGVTLTRGKFDKTPDGRWAVT